MSEVLETTGLGSVAVRIRVLTNGCRGIQKARQTSPDTIYHLPVVIVEDKNREPRLIPVPRVRLGRIGLVWLADSRAMCFLLVCTWWKIHVWNSMLMN